MMTRWWSRWQIMMVVVMLMVVMMLVMMMMNRRRRKGRMMLVMVMMMTRREQIMIKIMMVQWWWWRWRLWIDNHINEHNDKRRRRIWQENKKCRLIILCHQSQLDVWIQSLVLKWKEKTLSLSQTIHWFPSQQMDVHSNSSSCSSCSQQHEYQ